MENIQDLTSEQDQNARATEMGEQLHTEWARKSFAMYRNEFSPESIAECKKAMIEYYNYAKLF